MFWVLVFVAVVSGKSIVGGQGQWQYEYQPKMLQDPLSKIISLDSIVNGHGLCKDRKGQIYFTFDPKIVNQTSQAVVRFSADLATATLIGDSKLSTGVPHGLRIEYDSEVDQEFLYHANNKQLVFKTDLNGKILWTKNFTDWQQKYPKYWPLLPTDAIVVPGTDKLLVADGYGSSFIHVLNKHTGEYTGVSWGGPPGNSTTSPVKLHTPHGINVDPRSKDGSPVFVISDRSNHRLVWADEHGKFLDEQYVAGVFGMSFPCNVDVQVDRGINQMISVVPSLGGQTPGKYMNGSVSVYGPGIGRKATTLAVIEVAQLIGHLGHQHPHDAIFTPNGDIVVCCWSGPSDGPPFGPAKGTISYWKRVEHTPTP